MRVLLCSPHGQAVGGISRWTDHVLNYYQDNHQDLFLEHYYPDALTIYANSPSWFRILRGLLSYGPFLIRLFFKMQCGKYDLVHFASSGSFGLIRDWCSLLICRLLTVRTIVHFHFGGIPDCYEMDTWEVPWIDRISKLADRIIVLDSRSLKAMKERGHVNCELLPNPLSPRITAMIRFKRGISRRPASALFVGHVVPSKGIFELIAACREIPDIELLIVGAVSDRMRSELQEGAGSRGHEWLSITGQLGIEDVVEKMMAASVLILPSYTEGFPNVIIEGMACGCPIVATDVGAIREILNLEDGRMAGMIVNPKDVLDLRCAIERIISNTEIAHEYGRNAIEKVNSAYSMDYIWRRMVNIWRSVISNDLSE